MNISDHKSVYHTDYFLRITSFDNFSRSWRVLPCFSLEKLYQPTVLKGVRLCPQNRHVLASDGFSTSLIAQRHLVISLLVTLDNVPVSASVFPCPLPLPCSCSLYAYLLPYAAFMDAGHEPFVIRPAIPYSFTYLLTIYRLLTVLEFLYGLGSYKDLLILTSRKFLVIVLCFFFKKSLNSITHLEFTLAYSMKKDLTLFCKIINCYNSILAHCGRGI